ncbi:MAG: hypothetical protein M1820_007202 [Bogoriella megaspora]|nr:MAG: hypothetical protein M1820_007202 [Bogoriella megaspora]
MAAMGVPKNEVLTSAEWNRFAPSFMQLAMVGPGIIPAQRMVDLAGALAPFSKATAIIDMGCGPGQITNEVLAKCNGQVPSTARVIAADNSESMLEQIRARRIREIEQGTPSWERVEVLQTDIHNCLPIEDGSVSHVLAGFVFFLLPDPKQALDSVKRILAPDGLLATSSWQSSEWSDFMYYPLKVRPDLVIPKRPEEWATETGTRAALEAAGYRDIQVYTVQSFMPFEDHDDICRFILLKFPPAARASAQMTQEELITTQQLMIADLKEMYPIVPNRMSGTAIIATCRK